MKVTEVERRLSVSQKALKTVEAQVKATEEEFDRYRQAQRRTQEGGLKAEVARLQVGFLLHCSYRLCIASVFN
jgi:hypothetical protein